MSVVRIQNVPLAANKHISIALYKKSVYGIGRSRALKICSAVGVPGDIKVKDLTEEQVKAIQAECDKFVLEGDLRRKISMDIKHLSDIGCYRGLRHKKGLPVRGQRSKTNARTRKGPRGKTVSTKK